MQSLEFGLEDTIFRLHEELATHIWRHDAYAPFFVTDPKVRHIHKATVRDRLVHHALFRVLYPMFDRTFIDDSYSCRLDKGLHHAVARWERFCNAASRNDTRNVWALKLDVRRFFDSIDHGILRSLLWRKVHDMDTRWLIGVVLDSFQKTHGVGLPLGNVTSQLFANIYLNELDRFAKHRLGIQHYMRYCDDFIILLDDPAKANELIGELSDFLFQHLRLSIHPDKIHIRTWRQGIDFLGYVMRPWRRTMRTKTKRRMLKNINRKNSASYFGILRHCNGYGLEQKLRTKIS